MDSGFKFMKIAAFCWFAAAVLGSLPYIISGEIPGIADAFFESASGFSATGATVLGDVEGHSGAILFWRSITQWLGGMGFLISMAALMPSPNKLLHGYSITVKAAVAIYIFFTCLQTIFLLFGGLTLYDAALHAFSTVSTGGFSSYNDSVSHFGSMYVDTVFSLFMLLSAISFNLYYLILRRGAAGLRAFSADAELRLFTAVLIVSCALINADLILNDTFDSSVETAGASVVQTISILTTTGYVRTDFNAWPLFSAMILFSLMFVGSCGSSPGGGLKVVRVLLLFKLIARGILIRQHPNAVIQIKFSDKAVSREALSKSAGYFFLYVSLIAAAAILISPDGLGLLRSAGAAASALGNIGPMFCENGAPLDYSEFSNSSKILLSLLMLSGKLIFSYGTEKLNAS